MTMKINVVPYDKYQQEAKDIIVQAVLAERDRQDEKWGRDFQGRNHAFWLAILMEEIGEAARAYLEHDRGKLREELIQSAAVIFSWLEFFDDATELTDVRV